LNLQPYIDSGILELYALDALPDDEKKGVERMLTTYPQLKEELTAIELALENYAVSREITPPNYLEELVIESLLNLEKEKAFDVDDLPLINRFSDYRNWLPLLKSFEELPLASDGRHLKVLRSDEKVTQILIISTTDIEEETHEDEHESFLILEGECKCTVGDKVRLMGAGDYMEIPLYELHDVTLVSKRVVAVLQRIKVQ
jgi:mannose-6-phosphate isomerase-like protein (cupin superfamily)